MTLPTRPLLLLLILAAPCLDGKILLDNWNSFLDAKGIFPDAHQYSSALSKPTKAAQLDQQEVLTELETLLSKDKVLDELYNNYLVHVFKSTWTPEISSSYRQKVFQDNLMAIAKHNVDYMAGRETWYMAVTGHTHLTLEEFRLRYLKSTPQGDGTIICTWEEYNNLYSDFYEGPSGDAPSSLDWRNYNGQNIVSPAKNQLNCGDCYAFSAVATIESANAKKNGQPFLDLSEQDIRDCEGPPGCGGGYPYDVFNYTQQKGGLPTETDYPYQDDSFDNHTCSSGELTRYGNIAKFGILEPKGDEQKVVDALYKYGPVSILVDASEWTNCYGGGLFTRCTFNSLDHAVQLVGYTEDTFFIKNSWSDTWGDKGVITVPRGKNCNGLNSCIAYISEMV